METLIPVNNYEILTPDGFKDFSGIKLSINNILEIKTKTKTLKCTNKHLLKTKNNFKEIENIKVNEEIKTKNGYEKILTKKNIKNKVIVADLINVKDTHSYYTNDIISHNCLLVDEIAHIPHNLFGEFWNSIVPTISKAKDGRIIGITTANGLNFFYKLWQNAKKRKNNFKPFTAKWYEMPGRDEKFKEKMIGELGRQGWLQEFENEFLGSQNTLIDSEKIKELDFEMPVKEMLEGKLKVYNEPEDNHLYICGVDTAKGVNADYSVIQVIDASKYPLKQVAVYRSNTITPMLYGDVVTLIARMYNNAYVVIENNAEGKEVADNVWFTLEYTNMYNEEKDIGVRTTKLSKAKGLITFKELTECNKLILQDADTINEIGTFILKQNKTYSAQDNANDDTIMALSMACYFLRTEEFKEIYKQKDIRSVLYDKQINKYNDEFCLPVYRVDGDIVESNEEPDFLKELLRKEGVLLIEKDVKTYSF